MHAEGTVLGGQTNPSQVIAKLQRQKWRTAALRDNSNVVPQPAVGRFFHLKLIQTLLKN